MMSSALHLFQGYGIELEYMIVDRKTLSVKPIADRLLEAVAGEIVSEIEIGPLCWSNELVLHVVEFKTNGPSSSLHGLGDIFAEHVRRANGILMEMDARLMPTAAHPLMDPLRESRLWPHEYSPIYEAYDRIFGCSGHGWSNLQSTHINLPFSGDDEFGRLHAAIRLLMPVMPAITASSPILSGRVTGFLDSRLEVYGRNSSRIPSVAGCIIPEQAYSREEYAQKIFQPMYRDIAPHDADNILQHEFLNSRGAIARFDRGSIEIRILDIQECPAADLACAGLISEVLKHLVRERWTDLEVQQQWSVEALASIYQSCIKDAQSARIDNADYLRMFGYPGAPGCSAGELWLHLVEYCCAGGPEDPDWRVPLQCILEQGTLARRIVARLGHDPDSASIQQVYLELCDCLQNNAMFRH